MEERLKAIMADVLEISVEEINSDTSMDTLENWDSLLHLNLILALEEAFEVSFLVDEVKEMTDFLKIVAILEKHLAGK
jgi:acyl carrier protein